MSDTVPLTDCLKQQLDVLDAAIGALYEQRKPLVDRYYEAQAAQRSRDAYRESLTDEIRSAAKRHAAHHYAELADEAERDLPGLATP